MHISSMDQNSFSDSSSDVLNSVKLNEQITPVSEQTRYSGIRRKKKSSWVVCLENLPKRIFFAIISFWGMLSLFAMRANMSVAMTAVVNNTAIDRSDHIRIGCPVSHEGARYSTLANQHGVFAWDTQTQGNIHGSFYVGYILTQVMGGRLAENYGGKWVFGYGLFFTSIFTILTPSMAEISVYALIICRVLAGASEGVTHSTVHSMIAKWIPSSERSRFVSFINSGCPIGIAISMIVSGFVIDHMHWSLIFYLSGASGISCFVIWSRFVHSTPCDHPHISEKERLHIMTSTGHLYERPKQLKTPWKNLLMSTRVWAINIAHFGYNWGYYTLLMDMPLYLRQILQMPIKDGSALSALPFVGQAISQVISGMLADCLVARGKLNTTTSRKLFNSIAFYSPAMCLLAVAYFGCDVIAVISAFTLALTFAAAAYGGFKVNHIDIASNYAGTLYGFSNTMGTIPGFVAPSVVGFIMRDKESASEWRLIFFITAAVYVICNTLFLLLGTGEEQRWNQVVYEQFGLPVQIHCDLHKLEDSSEVLTQTPTSGIATAFTASSVNEESKYAELSE